MEKVTCCERVLSFRIALEQCAEQRRSDCRFVKRSSPSQRRKSGNRRGCPACVESCGRELNVEPYRAGMGIRPLGQIRMVVSHQREDEPILKSLRQGQMTFWGPVRRGVGYSGNIAFTETETFDRHHGPGLSTLRHGVRGAQVTEHHHHEQKGLDPAPWAPNLIYLINTDSHTSPIG
jgi:hypothetical protein